MTILPDVLQPNLKLVFCGTAASRISAEAGAYYANPGNKFWRTPYAVGFTPRQFTPKEFPTLLDYGIGLTDLAKYTFGVDSDLRREDFDGMRSERKSCIMRLMLWPSPANALPRNSTKSKFIAWGRQPDKIGSTVLFVLPSPSGLASRSWDISYWHEVAAFVRSLTNDM